MYDQACDVDETHEKLERESAASRRRSKIAFVFAAVCLVISGLSFTFAGEFRPWEKDDVETYKAASALLSHLGGAERIMEHRESPSFRYISLPFWPTSEFPVDPEKEDSSSVKILSTSYGFNMVMDGLDEGKVTYKELAPVFEKIRDRAAEELGDVTLRLRRQEVYEARKGNSFFSF